MLCTYDTAWPMTGTTQMPIITVAIIPWFMVNLQR